MIRFLTAGESHGKALTTIVEGIPSNLKISADYINLQLKRRQAGYGRGQRMKIESDQVEFLSGVRYGKTIGSPISMSIRNYDWENWSKIMSSETPEDSALKINIPRPGHADLVGVSKYNFDDVRNSVERSSARETAARVAACSVFRKLLEEFGISIGSYVHSIGGIYSKLDYLTTLLENRIPSNFIASSLSVKSDKSSVRVLDNSQEEKIINKIRTAKKKGDTLGGTFVVVATGLPVGLGSFMHYDLKLDAEIAHDILSINAVKAISIGAGFESADLYGSQTHDEIIIRNNSFTRKTNRSGGIEGGISTGMPIIVHAAMKPIATLMSPIKSVNLSKLKKVDARRERSDFVAVPACSVIAESMLAFTIAKKLISKFGGDSIGEMKANYTNYTSKLFNRVKTNFR